MSARKLGILVVLAAPLLGLAGCDDLTEFKTGRGTVFRGRVVGSDNDPERASFIRKGFASHTQMELSFDPYATGLPQDTQGDATPGRVHTYVCPVGRSDCKADDDVVGPLDRAQLEPIENLTHDALSEYTFPGGGRLRNYMFGARFTSPTASGDPPLQRNAMLFVSLMDSGQIEVRVISASVLAPGGQSEQVSALFGVFVLDRQAR